MGKEAKILSMSKVGVFKISISIITKNLNYFRGNNFLNLFELI